MHECHNKAHDVGTILQEFQWHQRVLCEATLAVYEENRHHTPEDNQTDHLWRVPWKCCSPEVKTKEKHHGQSYDGQTAEPVDGSHTIREFCPWVMNIKEEKNEEESQTREGKVNPEDPPPREEFGEYATKDRPDSTGDCPYAFSETKNESTPSFYVSIHGD